ncbi:MAG TPA: FUSC family protein [Microlunatus sp.]|nr:FUSC family protein [Microlunatus sp.]
MTIPPPDGSFPAPGHSRIRRLLDDLVRVQDAPHAHRVAVRAAIAVLLPLLALWSTGRLDLAAYATFGAFASVYGGGARTPHRWRTQTELAVILTLAVASGALVALSPQRSWWAIPVAAGWASFAAARSDRRRWRPPGPMFPVFAVATAAAIPSTPGQVLAATALTAATAALAIALGVVEVVLIKHTGIRPPDPPAAPLPSMPSRARQRIHLVRCGIVVLAAGTIATASGIGHPYWAIVASVTPLTVFTFRGQVVRGIHRVLGTMAGLLLAGALLLLALPAFAVVIIIAALQAATELLVVRHYGLALIFITPLALLSVQLAHPEPIHTLLADRFAETLIGVGVGVVAAVLTRNREIAG